MAGLDELANGLVPFRGSVWGFALAPARIAFEADMSLRHARIAQRSFPHEHTMLRVPCNRSDLVALAIDLKVLRRFVPLNVNSGDGRLAVAEVESDDFSNGFVHGVLFSLSARLCRTGRL